MWCSFTEDAVAGAALPRTRCNTTWETVQNMIVLNIKLSGEAEDPKGNV